MTHLQRLVLTVLDSKKDEQFAHYENKAGLGRVALVACFSTHKTFFSSPLPPLPRRS